jgi:hypothetical protein
LPLSSYRGGNTVAQSCFISTMIQPVSRRGIQGLILGPDVAFAVIGILAIRVSAVNEKPQPRAFTGLGVFDHLHVGIRIAER